MLQNVKTMYMGNREQLYCYAFTVITTVCWRRVHSYFNRKWLLVISLGMRLGFKPPPPHFQYLDSPWWKLILWARQILRGTGDVTETKRHADCLYDNRDDASW